TLHLPPPMPANQPTSTQPPYLQSSSSDPKRLIVWFIMGLVAVALLVGGTYVFLSKQAAVAPTSQTIVTQQARTQSLEVPQENLEADLNNLNVDTATDSDFTSIDQDLSQL
ncbi:hypothetical protein M1437_01835, partial [Patescibacteria group bacterium]|nr:hypothetical protein [Patescibacteria group bacterium]